MPTAGISSPRHLKYFLMAIVRPRIDVSDDWNEAWTSLQFDPIQKASLRPSLVLSVRVGIRLGVPHPKGEWIGAEITLQTPLLAQYAVSHYLNRIACSTPMWSTRYSSPNMTAPVPLESSTPAETPAKRHVDAPPHSVFS